MPKKRNNGGDMQPYIPKGNGPHSGEYTSISEREYIESKKGQEKYENIGLLLFPHISKYEKPVGRVISILEENNIPNIEQILDNLYIYDKYQHYARDYDINKCKSLDDLEDFFEKFYDKYHLASLKRSIDLIRKGKNDKINNEGYHYYLGSKMIKGIHSLNDDCRLANPNYEKDESYQNNCINCVLAMEMRIRNYDVEAMPYINTLEDGDINKLYKVFNYDILLIEKPNNSPNTMTNIFKELKRNDGDSRYIFSYMRCNNKGHVLELIIKNGSITLYDPQSGFEVNSSSLDLDDIKFFKYDRIDNVGINIKEAKKYVKERKS